MVACLEEIAFKLGYLSESELLESADTMPNSDYGQYLKRLATGSR
jgi:glucose-1-phosphate thymidylyltransferase